jgi:hypothetical protein
MATRFMPKCFHAGRYDPSMQIQNPTEVIKRGYFVRVNVYVNGNGVKPNETNKKPGIYLSPNLVELVGYGEEIQSGPDAADRFGKAGAPVYLPPGMSATPVAGAGAAVGALPGLPGIPGAASVPALPGVAVPALPALPGLPPVPGAPVGLPALPGLPPVPGAPVGLPALPVPGAVAHVPVFTMTAKAQGLTREQMHAQQWTDALMLEHGYAVMQ